jgi:enoyl-CoA hydratase/carnithine racemase
MMRGAATARLLAAAALPIHRCRDVAGLARAAPSLCHSSSRSASTLVSSELNVDTGVAVLTLNAPAKMNALTEEMGAQFRAAVGTLRHEPPTRLRCVVLTGAGSERGPAFSAGGDLAWLMERHHDSPTNNAAIMRDFYDRFLGVRSLPVPVIAAIDGPAIGAGFALACACDVRLAHPASKLGVTFVGLGLPPGMVGGHFVFFSSS